MEAEPSGGGAMPANSAPREVLTGPLARLDHALFELINGHLHHPVLDVLLAFLTDFANFKIPLILAGVLILVLGNARLKTTAIWALVAVLLADMIGQDMKLLFERWRPYWVLEDVRWVTGEGRSQSYSLPSNHAVNTAAAGMTFLLSYWPRWRVVLPAVLVPLLVAWSRVYVGVHFPLDVLCGALLGVAVASGLHLINRTEPILAVERGTLVVGWKGLALFLIGVATLYRLSNASRAWLPLGGPELAGWYAAVSPFRLAEFGVWPWQVLSKVWALPFGVSELSFRALAVAASLGVLCLAWRTSNALGHDRRMRLVFLLLVLLSPFQVLGALLLQPVSLSALPMAAGVLFVLLAARGERPAGWLYGLIAFSAALFLEGGAVVFIAALLLSGWRNLTDAARGRPLLALVAFVLFALALTSWLARFLGYTTPVDPHHLPGTAPWIMMAGAIPMVAFCAILALAGRMNRRLVPAAPLFLSAAFLLGLTAFILALLLGKSAAGAGTVAWYGGALLAAPRIVAFLVMPHPRRRRILIRAGAVVAVAAVVVPAAKIHDREAWWTVGMPLLPEDAPHLDPAWPYLGGRELGRALGALSSDHAPAVLPVTTSPGDYRSLAALYHAGSRDASRFLPWDHFLEGNHPPALVMIVDNEAPDEEIPRGYTEEKELIIPVEDDRHTLRTDRMVLLLRQ